MMLENSLSEQNLAVICRVMYFNPLMTSYIFSMHCSKRIVVDGLTLMRLLCQVLNPDSENHLLEFLICLFLNKLYLIKYLFFKYLLSLSNIWQNFSWTIECHILGTDVNLFLISNISRTWENSWHFTSRTTVNRHLWLLKILVCHYYPGLLNWNSHPNYQCSSGESGNVREF